MARPPQKLGTVASGEHVARGFLAWLYAQTDAGERDDLVSDVAHDVRRDKRFPQSSPAAAQRAYLARFGEHVVGAWDEARREYAHGNRLRRAARLGS